MLDDRFFLHCTKCGKRLIERQANGLFHFVFGKKKDLDGKLAEFCPVDLYIHGSLKMRCLARGCGHLNTFNYFPNPEEPQPAEESTGSLSFPNNKEGGL